MVYLSRTREIFRKADSLSQSVFISYAHADGTLLDRLHKHLAQLKREGSISEWFDREIIAGSNIDNNIRSKLNSADIFLACASPDWIASQYAFEQEFEIALEREKRGEAIIVPVIFSPCDWLSTPLKTFKAVPKDGRPIVEFVNKDVALLDVVTELRRLITSRSKDIVIDASGFTDPSESVSIRASQYRVRKEFDDLHKRDFVEQSFGEIFRFFESSAAEISTIPDIEVRLTSIENDRFSCTMINRGISRGFASLTVRKGGSFSAIDIVYGDNPSENTSNGGFSVHSDEYQLMLRPSMFSMTQRDKPVSGREAGKLLWDDLLSKVGIEYA